MSASASPGLKNGDVIHAIVTRGSSTRSWIVTRRSAVIFGVSIAGFGTGVALLERPEIFLDQRLGRRLVDVADDREAGVVGRVIQLEEILHVFELRRLDVGMRSDDVGVVRMVLRKQLVEHRLVDDAVRLVLDALPALVADDVLLVREIGLIDHVEQVAHAIGFEPQPEFELVRRQRFEVVRAIEVGRAVDVAAAGALDGAEVRVALHVLRALEHHVLEQVGETGAPRLFVGRPDVIPEIHRDQRQPVILGEDHVEPVGQRVFFEVDFRDVARLLRRRRVCAPCAAADWRRSPARRRDRRPGGTVRTSTREFIRTRFC